MKKALVWIAGVIVLASGCDSAPDAAPPDVISKDGAALVQVGRDAPSQMTGMSAVPVGVSNGNNNFYLAIRKDALQQRWLLSGYVKQLQPFNGDFTLGTRVVTFSVQNDKMFLFDALDGQKQSSIINPAEVLEAYPIVHLPAFDQLPGASNYVLFDPATGLNKFSVNSQIYTEPFLTSITGGTTLPMKVGLSFMQNFRAISGGASYEQVIAGSFEGGGAPFSVWATLGLSLRRYFEGDGFVPFEVHPLTDNTDDLRHFFLADNRIVPESGFDVVADQWHWNLHKGMKPIPVSVTAGIKRAQADFPDVDLLGAAKRGVESWNAVLGYRAFSVVFVDDDDVRDPDQNTVLVDYPGANLGYAFADWRGNPATGETLAASVYMDGGFFDDLRRQFGVDPLPDTSVAVARPATNLPATKLPATKVAAKKLAAKKLTVSSLVWGGLTSRRHACIYPTLAYRKDGSARLSGPKSLTPQQQAARLIEAVIAHEWGHVLGLRHNFRGSLVPPTSSIMDYNTIADTVAQPTAGAYDIDAINYLYGKSPDLPTQPFCTDEDIGIDDPQCQTYDSKANPLHEWFLPRYTQAQSDAIANDDPFLLTPAGLFELLDYAFDNGLGKIEPGDAAFAATLLFGRFAVPLSPADAADPAVLAVLDDSSNLILGSFYDRQNFPAAAEAAGFPSEFIPPPLTDSDVMAFVVEQSGRMLRNEDGVRGFGVRRLAVDFLKLLANSDAFLELKASQAAIQASVTAGTVSAADLPFTQDLLARIGVALTPYFL